jgi:hypothetical protein
MPQVVIGAVRLGFASSARPRVMGANSSEPNPVLRWVRCSTPLPPHRSIGDYSAEEMTRSKWEARLLQVE